MQLIIKAKQEELPTLHKDMVKKPDYDHLVHHTSKEAQASILKNGFKTGTNPHVMNGVYARHNQHEGGSADLPAHVKIHTKKDARVADLGTNKAMDLLHGFGSNHYHHVYHHIMKKMGYQVKEEHAGKDPYKYYGDNAKHIQDMSKNRRGEFYHHFGNIMKHNKIDVVENGAEHIVINPHSITKLEGGSNVRKSVMYIIKAKKSPVGTISEWKAGKYIKDSQHHWKLLQDTVNSIAKEAGAGPHDEETKLLHRMAKGALEHIKGHSAPNLKDLDKHLDNYDDGDYDGFDGFKEATKEVLNNYVKEHAKIKPEDKVESEEKKLSDVDLMGAMKALRDKPTGFVKMSNLKKHLEKTVGRKLSDNELSAYIKSNFDKYDVEWEGGRVRLDSKLAIIRVFPKGTVEEPKKPVAGEPMTDEQMRRLKSEGHIGYGIVDNTVSEYFNRGDKVYRAPLYQAVMMNGQRSGRWFGSQEQMKDVQLYGTIEQAEKMKKNYGKMATAEIVDTQKKEEKPKSDEMPEFLGGAKIGDHVEVISANNPNTKIYGVLERIALGHNEPKSESHGHIKVTYVEGENKQKDRKGDTLVATKYTGIRLKKMIKNPEKKKEEAEPKGLREHLKAFAYLLHRLSPERLYRDGEASASEVKRDRDSIMKEWKALETKIGRKVTEGDIWKEYEKEKLVKKGILSKAKKLVVGTIRKWADGRYIKDNEHHWTLLKEIVDKVASEAGAGKGHPETRLLHRMAGSALKHIKGQDEPSLKALSQHLDKHDDDTYDDFDGFKNAVIHVLGKYVEEHKKLKSGKGAETKTVQKQQKWADLVAAQDLPQDKMDLWVGAQFLKAKKPFLHLLLSARKVIGDDKNIEPSKGFKGLCHVILTRAYERGPEGFEHDALDRFTKAFDTYFEKVAASKKGSITEDLDKVNALLDKVPFYKEHEEWFHYCVHRLMERNGAVNYGAIKPYMQNAMKKYKGVVPDYEGKPKIRVARQKKLVVKPRKKA
jgi:hypothetical protein